MLKIFLLVLFCWFLFGSIRFMFRVTWGLIKLLATFLFVLALPALISGLLQASVLLLLLPVGLALVAWSILAICV